MSAPRRNARRLMVGDPIPAYLSESELRSALGYGRTQFWRLKRSGAFDTLRVLIGGVVVYSGAKLLAADATHAEPESSGRRFLSAARNAQRNRGRSAAHRKPASESSREGGTEIGR